MQEGPGRRVTVTSRGRQKERAKRGGKKREEAPERREFAEGPPDLG